jgi:preprotein translocase subunit SecF
MQLLSHVPTFDFMGRRRLALTLSISLIVISIAAVAVRGINWGIDFTGGVLLEVGYPQPVELEDIRATLGANGIDNAVVQSFGSATDVLIRLPPLEGVEDEASLGEDALAALRQQNPGVERRGGTFVGPQVGEDLTEQGGLAMFFALLFIFAYVMLRFRWKFAVGAIAALVHDVIITVGFFAVTQISFDLSVLAAILAVIGYSLNDTIVVYDRIRENFRAIRRGTAEHIINTSINQTLARTLITALTTLLVLAALALFGGEAVFGFSIALIVGIVIGTYSSIYVASAAALLLDVSPMDLMPPKRETIDDLP